MNELALKEVFPHEEMWTGQEEALKVISENPRVVFEQPQGAGKTAVGLSMLRALRSKNDSEGAYLYTAPNKTIANQVRDLYPEVKVVYGKNEYLCPYYQERDQEVWADQAPCHLLDCSHRAAVGEENPEVEPCPYYQAIQNIRQGDVVACTMSLFLINEVFRDWMPIEGLVLDEVHQITRMARLLFGYDITDYKLKRLVRFLRGINRQEQAERLDNFLDEMRQIAQNKGQREPLDLLTGREIRRLSDKLQEIFLEDIVEEVRRGIRRDEIDEVASREDLNMLEEIDRDIERYVQSFRYALEEEGGRNPLNYVFAFCRRNRSKRQRVKYKLCIKNHYIAPLIGKALKRKISRIVGYSATIGDEEVFEMESGIDFPVRVVPSEISADNARIYHPSDIPNLATSKREPLDLIESLEEVAKAVETFAANHLRSLVVVVSEEERRQFLELVQDPDRGFGFEAISYGNGTAPKEAAISFREGQGNVLVGTAANYSHGIDLPGDTCLATFFLKPSYLNPQSPQGQFERNRFEGEETNVWRIWNYRATIEARQVRGRNIRGKDDVGVTFLVSENFSNLFPAGLPEWLQSSWREGELMEQQVKQAIDFLT